MLGPTLEVTTMRESSSDHGTLSILGKRKSNHIESLLKCNSKRRNENSDVGDVLDELGDVGNYETITDYMQILTEGGEEIHLYSGIEEEKSPGSVSSGYQSVECQQENEDSNLSWLLTFKVASLFDPLTEQPRTVITPPVEEEGQEKPFLGVKCAPPKIGKPPYTYTELIELALKENGQLTVADIYTWISSRFPYFKANDDRWKNSIRHNLSINPQFRKGLKAKRGAGHLWKLSTEGATPPESWKPNFETVVVDEVEQATASITEMDTTIQDPGLHRTAEEILSGVKKRVEVEYLRSEQNSNDEVKSEDPYSSWLPARTILVVVPPTNDIPSRPPCVKVPAFPHSYY